MWEILNLFMHSKFMYLLLNIIIAKNRKLWILNHHIHLNKIWYVRSWDVHDFVKVIIASSNIANVILCIIILWNLRVQLSLDLDYTTIELWVVTVCKMEWTEFHQQCFLSHDSSKTNWQLKDSNGISVANRDHFAGIIPLSLVR